MLHRLCNRIARRISTRNHSRSSLLFATTCAFCGIFLSQGKNFATAAANMTEVDPVGIQSMPGADKATEAPSEFVQPSLQKPRTITQAVESQWQGEGQGARVRRSIGRPELKNLGMLPHCRHGEEEQLNYTRIHGFHFADPFLLLDEFYVGKPAGFPDHPHRGFETVTYILTGSFTHEDFAGHKVRMRKSTQYITAFFYCFFLLTQGTINPGDLQWMTAGKGIVHSEVPVSV